MGLDFDKLCDPYRAPTEEGGPERTPEGQRRWLTERKGIREDVVDSAMAVVYARMERGKTFSSGHELDRYLLRECEKQQLAKHAALLRVNSANTRKIMDAAKDQATWRDVLPWFGLGVAVGAALEWLWIVNYGG